jgi:threonine/homoserine/homoserine lactone efflux protein
MLPLILSVVLISFAGAIVPGPILAVTIAKSFKSPWAGLQIALGHVFINISVILLIYFGLSQFLQIVTVQVILSILGGILIIWLGINMFRTRAKIVYGSADLRYSAFTLGILTTVLNPMFLLWWATIGSMFIMKFHEFGITGLIAFIFAMELPNLTWYPFASVVTYKTSSSLRGQRIKEWLFIICSMLLIGFGVWFVVSGIQMIL